MRKKKDNKTTWFNELTKWTCNKQFSKTLNTTDSSAQQSKLVVPEHCIFLEIDRQQKNIVYSLSFFLFIPSLVIFLLTFIDKVISS
jgi:hypothetical protein